MVDSPVARQRVLRKLTLCVAAPMSVLCLFCIAAYGPPRTTPHAMENEVVASLQHGDWEHMAALYDNPGTAARDLAVLRRLARHDGTYVVDGANPHHDDVITIAFVGTVTRSTYMLHFSNRFVPVAITLICHDRIHWRIAGAHADDPISEPTVVQSGWDGESGVVGSGKR